MREVLRGRAEERGLQAGRVREGVGASVRLVTLVPPSGNLARIPRFVILFSVLRGGVRDDAGVAVDVESLANPVSHASLLCVLDGLEEQLVGVFNGQGCEGLLLTETLVEGDNGCGGFDQIAVSTDVEFTLRTGNSVEAECGKKCTRGNILGLVLTEAQLTQGWRGSVPRNG